MEHATPSSPPHNHPTIQAVHHAIKTKMIPQRLWADVYRFQKEYSPVHAALGAISNGIVMPEDLPPTPTTIFRFCSPFIKTSSAAAGSAKFISTGTTSGEDLRAHHNVSDLSLYELSLISAFESTTLSTCTPQAILFLSPHPNERPDSSLVHMLNILGQHFFPDAEKEYGLVDGAMQWDRIQHLFLTHNTILILGITSAVRQLAQNPPTIKKNQILGVMDTGGDKGQISPQKQSTLMTLYKEKFNIPSKYIVNEYGMTELLSQCYSTMYNGIGPVKMKAPPWMWVGARDPQTLHNLPFGHEGLLSFVDLANIYSISSVVTEDMGLCHEDGSFTINGRADTVDARGCSWFLNDEKGV